MISESSFLRKNGIDQKLINEGLTDWLKSFIKASGGGLFDAFQERLVTLILKSLGVKTDSYFANLLITGFGNLDLNNMGKIISGDCNTIVKVIAETLLEAVVRRKQSSVEDSNGTGMLGDVFRNIIFDAVFKDKVGILTKIEDAISQPICSAFEVVKSKLIPDSEKLIGMGDIPTS